MMEKFAILLVRVSTLTQNYEPQIDDLKKFAQLKGYNKLHIIETKETGLADLDKKVGTNQLFDFIKSNPEYRVVFATEISRLGRRQSVLHQIKEWFIKNQVQFYAKDTGYSLLDENGKISMAGEMMFSLYGLFAENEIQQKKDRFSRSKRSLMEMGLSISGKTLFGYERIQSENGKNTLKIHEENSEIIRIIYNWYLNGISVFEKNVSIKRISLECIKKGYPKYTHSKRNLNKLLKEKGYTGFKVTNNKRRNKNFNEESDKKEEQYFVSKNSIKYPIIIDSDTFEKVQLKLKENNSKVDKSTIHTTLLSKIIKCDKCAGHFNADYRFLSGRNVSSYRCSSRSKVIPCGNKYSISMSMIDNSIWSLIRTDISALSNAISHVNPDEQLESLKSEKNQLELRITEIDKEVQSLYQKYKSFSKMNFIKSNEILETMEERISKLDKEKGEIENEIANISLSMSVKHSNIDDEIDILKKNIETIECSKELLKKYINIFVNKIEILIHSKQYSVFKVNFKFYTNTTRSVKPSGNVSLSELKSSITLIINKTNTNKILIFKSVYPIIIMGDNKIILKDMQDVSNRKTLSISLNDLTSDIYKPYFSEVELYKLKIH